MRTSKLIAGKRLRFEKFGNREGWLNSRGIGGSDIGVICGLSSFKTIDELLTDKIYGSDDDNKTELMVNGTLAEPHIRALFALSAKDEFQVIDPPKGNWLFRDPELDYLTVSPDGLLVSKSTNEIGGLEIKFSEIRSKAQAEKWADNIPTYYFAQCAWYLNCIPDLQFVILCAYLKHYVSDGDGNWIFDHAEVKTYRVDRRDPSTQKFMETAKAKAVKFHENIKERKLPPLRIKL